MADRTMTRVALSVIDEKVGYALEDKIEAYQFLCDTWQLDRLTPYQQAEYNMLVEGGIIQTAVWRPV
jgi:hypothetical protein